MKRINWRYTIGEIVIVSIGILIAFSINKCSSTITKNNGKKEYIESIKSDILENIESLDSIIEKQRGKTEQLQTVITLIEQKSTNLSEIGEILFRQRKSPTFFPVNGTFKSLVAQGQIEVFSTALKRDLFNLYDTKYERTVYNGKLYDDLHIHMYDHQLRTIMNMATKEIDNPNGLFSDKFVETLSIIIDEARSYIALLEETKAESKTFLSSLP